MACYEAVTYHNPFITLRSSSAKKRHAYARRRNRTGEREMARRRRGTRGMGRKMGGSSSLLEEAEGRWREGKRRREEGEGR
jgi:hypothetical protein